MYLRTVLRNIFSSWAGYVVALLTGFLLSPFAVHHLGNKGYGVWTLIASLTGYFGLLDLGIRSTVGRFVARYLALDDIPNVNRTVNTAIAILSLGGMLAIAATLTLYSVFWMFKIEPGFETAAKTSLLIIGLNIALSLPLGVSGGILIALERFDIATAVSIAGTLTRAGLYVVSLRAGKGIVAIASVTLCVSLAESAALALCAKRLYKPLRVGLSYVDLSNGKELFGFSIHRFTWTIANQLIFYTDSVVIGLFLNAAAITSFSIAGTLVGYGRNLVSLATDTFYPVATRLDSKEDRVGLRDLQIASTKISLVVCLPLCIGLTFLGRQFISLWMGTEYASSAIYLTILAVPQVLGMSQSGSCVLLAGIGKHKMLAYVALGEGIVNVALSIILIRQVGLVGVAWGTAIPHVITNGLIIPLYTLRQLQLGVSDYFLRTYAPALMCAIPVAAYCYALSSFIQKLSWTVFLGEAVSVCGLFGVLAYNVCLSPDQRSAIIARVLGRVNREALIDGV